jgi:glycosyltransferase involved in cell wall biosynthesis
LRILLVTTRYPWPPRRGDQVRAAQMAELLSPEHRVTLLTPAPPAGWPAPPGGLEVETYRPASAAGLGGGRAGTSASAFSALRALGGAARGLPLQTGLFSSPDLGRRLRRLAPAADLVVLQLVRLAAHLDDAGATPVLVDLIDDLALNLARRAAFDRAWLRPVLALESRLLARAQLRLANRAAGVLLVCERDRRHLVDALPPALAARVATVGLAVEGTVDAETMAAEPAAAAARSELAGPPEVAPLPPSAAPGQLASVGASGERRRLAPPPAAPPRLVFTGNLGYFVNADAIGWWLGTVWPALCARHPGLHLVVAGDRPAPATRRAVARAAVVVSRGLPAAGSPAGAVELVESAPDLRRVLADATIALAPLRCGSGVPVKVLEAWAAGVPVVASPWAAAGTTGVPGEDLAVAESPHQWVEAILRLLGDPAERCRLAANGRHRLAADYSRSRVRGQLLAALAGFGR